MIMLLMGPILLISSLVAADEGWGLDEISEFSDPNHIATSNTTFTKVFTVNMVEKG